MKLIDIMKNLVPDMGDYRIKLYYDGNKNPHWRIQRRDLIGWYGVCERGYRLNGYNHLFECDSRQRALDQIEIILNEYRKTERTPV